MRKYKCLKCEASYIRGSHRTEGVDLGGLHYCPKCYKEAWNKFVIKVLADHGVEPLVLTETDDCAICEGVGMIQHFTTHAWSETCIECYGTGSISEAQKIRNRAQAVDGDGVVQGETRLEGDRP